MDLLVVGGFRFGTFDLMFWGLVVVAPCRVGFDDLFGVLWG